MVPRLPFELYSRLAVHMELGPYVDTVVEDELQIREKSRRRWPLRQREGSQNRVTLKQCRGELAVIFGRS